MGGRVDERFSSFRDLNERKERFPVERSPHDGAVSVARTAGDERWRVPPLMNHQLCPVPLTEKPKIIKNAQGK